MRLIINGIGYDTRTAEFDVFIVLPKKLRNCEFLLKDRTFWFSDGSPCKVSIFTNRAGQRMARFHGDYRGYAYNLQSYFIARRADVTTYINKLKNNF